jgi:hypothetical protein
MVIYGEVKNNANITDYNLSIKKDGVEIFSDAFTLDPGEKYEFTTSTSSETSFTLEGTVDGVTVTDFVRVEKPNVNVSIIAPDIVGLADFDVGVLIENLGNIAVDLGVSINSTWNITVPEGELRLLETTKNITKNTTLNVTISGDINKIIQKEIIFGENVMINITPQSTYLEGTVEIPYTIENIGLLDSEFDATFSVDNQTISESFFVPKGQSITDSVSFNLSKGAHLLRYTSPFEEVNVAINVLSPPEFVVTSIFPTTMNFRIGQNITLTFVVENIGGTEGEATLSLGMPDFEETNRTWIRPGEKENISFRFAIPDDLEEKSYKGFYELDGERDEFTFFVQGVKISVDASLDKDLYEEGETAILILDVTNVVTSISDPNEGNLVDIKQAYANVNDTDVNFQVETYSSITEAWGYMWLDTDQDPITGATDAIHPGYGLNDIGAEYLVYIDLYSEDASLYRWTDYGFEFVSYLPLSLNAYHFTISIPLSDIADDGIMDMSLMMTDYDETSIDIAPNEGHGTTGYYFDLSLYARVKLGDYEDVKHFILTDFETLQFDVPVHFNGQKLFYGVYMESGRALYLNAMYIHKREIITLYTDKQVYNAGENVTIFVDTTKSGTLNVTAPGFNTSIFVTGSTTLEFTLPKELRSGTYYIDYTFDDFSSAYPFDVIGYSARILECNLDKGVYNQRDVVKVEMNVEVNQNISGVLKMWIYDPQNNVVDIFEMDKNFLEGENKIELSRSFLTNLSGIHVLVYGIYAHSDLIFLASGAEYFDVEIEDTTPPSVTNPTATPPSMVADGIQESQLNVTVTDESGIARVTVDLSDIGGSPAQEIDNIPGTAVYTVNTTTAVGTAPDTYYLQVNTTDIYGNSNTSVSIALTVTEAEEDTTPPTIESVTLDAYTTIPDATIHVTVEATDNVGVTSVTADGFALVETGSIWEGNITAPSTTGDYTLTIRAEDGAGNFNETTVDYSVVTPQGGMGIAVLPRLSPVTAGSTVDLNVKIVSNENFDDVFHIYLTTNGLPPAYQADLSWFNWTDTTVAIPAGGEALILLRADIPDGVSGYKAFRAMVESTKWTPKAMDTGIFSIS